MDEEKKAAREIEKTAAGDTNEGNKPKASTIVDEAIAAAERLKTERELAEKVRTELANLQAKRVLGGESSGPTTEKKEEETPAEYAKRVMSGQI